jgi:putative ABC transport system permease protein
MFIIAFGIMALVGILTSIDAIKGAINTQFAFMGANTFAIQSRGVFIQIGSERYRSRNYSYISYKQAEDFKKAYNFPATVSISCVCYFNWYSELPAKKRIPTSG